MQEILQEDKRVMGIKGIGDAVAKLKRQAEENLKRGVRPPPPCSSSSNKGAEHTQGLGQGTGPGQGFEPGLGQEPRHPSQLGRDGSSVMGEPQGGLVRQQQQQQRQQHQEHQHHQHHQQPEMVGLGRRAGMGIAAQQSQQQHQQQQQSQHFHRPLAAGRGVGEAPGDAQPAIDNHHHGVGGEGADDDNDSDIDLSSPPIIIDAADAIAAIAAGRGCRGERQRTGATGVMLPLSVADENTPPDDQTTVPGNVPMKVVYGNGSAVEQERDRSAFSSQRNNNSNNNNSSSSHQHRHHDNHTTSPTSNNDHNHNHNHHNNHNNNHNHNNDQDRQRHRGSREDEFDYSSTRHLPSAATAAASLPAGKPPLASTRPPLASTPTSIHRSYHPMTDHQMYPPPAAARVQPSSSLHHHNQHQQQQHQHQRTNLSSHHHPTSQSSSSASFQHPPPPLQQRPSQPPRPLPPPCRSSQRQANGEGAGGDDLMDLVNDIEGFLYGQDGATSNGTGVGRGRSSADGLNGKCDGGDNGVDGFDADDEQWHLSAQRHPSWSTHTHHTHHTQTHHTQPHRRHNNNNNNNNDVVATRGYDDDEGQSNHSAIPANNTTPPSFLDSPDQHIIMHPSLTDIISPPSPPPFTDNAFLTYLPTNIPLITDGPLGGSTQHGRTKKRRMPTAWSSQHTADASLSVHAQRQERGIPIIPI